MTNTEIHSTNNLSEEQNLSEAEVGLYWNVDGVIKKVGEPINNAASLKGVYSMTAYTHAAYWKELRNRKPHLPEDFEYYPRGRVSYDKRIHQWTIHMDPEDMDNEDIKRKILRAFKIPIAGTDVVFRSGAPYKNKRALEETEMGVKKKGDENRNVLEYNKKNILHDKMIKDRVSDGGLNERRFDNDTI